MAETPAKFDGEDRETLEAAEVGLSDCICVDGLGDAPSSVDGPREENSTDGDVCPAHSFPPRSNVRSAKRSKEVCIKLIFSLTSQFDDELK